MRLSSFVGLRASKNARNAERPRNCTLPKRTSQSSVKPSTSASMFHGMNSDSTCATNARASSIVRALRPASVRNAWTAMDTSLSRPLAL